MAELERTKTITLIAPLEGAEKNVTYESLQLKAPALVQVEQFYERQATQTSLSAMRLLICLVTGVPEGQLQKMDYIDFKKCEEYLLGFLTWKP
jgi:hypothetical protein